jgi:tripartite-type tricarboxylate transporter receptor subunit TctC
MHSANTPFALRRTFLYAALAVIGGGMALPSAHAQTWPSKPVRLVVPFAAGGPADSLGRFIAGRMSAELGQTVVIDNKAGAGGTLGANDVIRSSDGHSFLFASTGAMVIFPAISPSPNYRPDRDLVAVGQAVNTPGVVVVSAKSRFTKHEDLIAFAKANPGRLNYASAGNGTSTHLGIELLKREAGVFMTHIPYRGASPAITDLISGTVDMMFADVPAVVNFIESGQLRGLAVADPKRSPALPNIPTTAEVGFKNIIGGTWYGLLGPTSTPPEVVQKLNAALNKVLQQPETLAFFKTQGVAAAAGTPQDFARFIQSESSKWAGVVRSSGIKPD